LPQKNKENPLGEREQNFIFFPPNSKKPLEIKNEGEFGRVNVRGFEKNQKKKILEG
jgi:hypothetical protein